MRKPTILIVPLDGAHGARYAQASTCSCALQNVLADSPGISAAQLQLGVALARTRRYPEAISSLHKAVALIPDSTQARYELGLALFETGAWQDSAPYFEFVAQKRPKFPDAQYSLAAVYARTQRVSEAVELLHKVLEES